jgi:hypothetical protein
MATKNVVPRTGSEGEIGTSAKPWNKVHAQEVSASSVSVSSTSPYSNVNYGSLTANGTAGGLIDFQSGNTDKARVYSNYNDLKLQSLSGDIVLTPDTTGQVEVVGNLDVSGSSRFGNELTDTHVFTGSFHQTGSGATSYFKDTIDIEGNLTASGHVSASAFFGDGTGITGVTGDWDGQHDGDAGITGSLELSGPNGNLTASAIQITTDGNPAIVDANGDVKIQFDSDEIYFYSDDPDDAAFLIATNMIEVAPDGDLDFRVGGSSNKLFVDVSEDLVIVSGSISASHHITASGHVSASAFYGDGSNLSGIGGSPGGSNTQIQFNSGSTFSGSSTLVYDYASGNMGLGTTTPASYTNYSTLTLNNATLGGGLEFQTAGTRRGLIYNNATNMYVFAEGGELKLHCTNGDITIDNDTASKKISLNSILEVGAELGPGSTPQASLSGHLSASGQIYASGENKGIQTATAGSPGSVTIDWNDGMTQEITLSSSTSPGTVSASFNNIQPYTTYQLINKIAKDNMELYFDYSIYWPGGIRPSLSNISGSRDIITFTTDGDSNMYGTAQFDYSASVG